MAQITPIQEMPRLRRRKVEIQKAGGDGGIAAAAKNLST